MAVIADTRLIERRLDTLRSRRDQGEPSHGAGAPMPEWAADALVALGMTRAEIAAGDALAAAEGEREEPGVADSDDAIGALEEELLRRGDRSPATLHALAELALSRLKRSAPTDPNDVFYDAGEARAVALFEHVVGGLEQLRDEAWRHTG